MRPPPDPSGQEHFPYDWAIVGKIFSTSGQNREIVPVIGSDREIVLVWCYDTPSASGHSPPDIGVRGLTEQLFRNMMLAPLLVGLRPQKIGGDFLC